MKHTFIATFAEVGKEDGPLVGGKGANLGEMVQAGFPVPAGFIVTSDAYKHFLAASGLRDKIRDLLHGLDVNESKKLDSVSAKVRTLITRSHFPKDIATEVIRAYLSLERGALKHAWVAVRSSATAEDLPTASFAGQQDTYLNVRGEANLIEKIREAWASLFTSRAIFYRATHKFDHFSVSIAIPVQKMVESDTSGVMFTIDPVTNDNSKVIIEAIYGLGELIVQGSVTPDHFVVDKKSAAIIAKDAKYQEKMLVRKNGGNRIVPLSQKQGSQVKLTDRQVLSLADIAQRLEKHYFFPQDVEWAIEKGKIYIVQTRPVTTVQKQATGAAVTPSTGGPKPPVFLKGDPASPGAAAGPVKILRAASEIHKVMKGDVLVADMTNPDFVPAMRKACAIVTQRGGRTSHAAIVSREMGIPAVVGVPEVLKNLKDGTVITVNGTTGELFKGSVVSNIASSLVVKSKYAGQKLKTATRVLVNLADPSRAGLVGKMNVDGIGLMRAEFIMSHIGTHPRKFIEDKKEKQFVSELAEGMGAICRALNPRPVVYRASDFKTNEFRNLKGGEKYEPKEENPMLGFRGAARYIADPRVFELELEAIKMVRNKMGLKNLYLMIPFVRSPKELLEVKKLVTSSGLFRSPTFKFWLMVELPTNVILIDQYIDVGIDGISFGSNDLTMLILGVDRDNSEVAKNFYEMDDAVLWAFERVIKACNKRGVTSSMCGQAPSDYPELVDKLVRWGITSISVNIDAAERVRETVYEAEKKLVAGKR